MTKKWQISLVAIFLLAEICFTVLSQILTGQTLEIVEYVSISLCLALALIFVTRNRFNCIICVGLAFTLCADACLVFCKPIQQTYGMVFFSLAQLTYAVYLMIGFSKKTNLIMWIIRLLGSYATLIVTSVVLKDNFDFLSAISMFYIFNLAFNLVLAYVHFKKYGLLALGFTFFIFCDILIGLGSANGVYITIASQTIRDLVASNIAWAFYIPSQTLIALTATFSKLQRKPRLFEIKK